MDLIKSAFKLVRAKPVSFQTSVTCGQAFRADFNSLGEKSSTSQLIFVWMDHCVVYTTFLHTLRMHEHTVSGTMEKLAQWLRHAILKLKMIRVSHPEHLYVPFRSRMLFPWDCVYITQGVSPEQMCPHASCTCMIVKEL